MAYVIQEDSLVSTITNKNIIISGTQFITSRPSRIYRKGIIRFCKECDRKLSIYNPHNRCSFCQRHHSIK